MPYYWYARLKGGVAVEHILTTRPTCPPGWVEVSHENAHSLRSPRRYLHETDPITVVKDEETGEVEIVGYRSRPSMKSGVYLRASIEKLARGGNGVAWVSRLRRGQVATLEIGERSVEVSNGRPAIIRPSDAVDGKITIALASPSLFDLGPHGGRIEVNVTPRPRRRQQ